ncbi:hypothetical protein N0M98_28015 [Paenibacillus doosanensis]|uniref:Uncharacterized protein n=1 Tax=Paenibacillus konkukensis TaxID=2020716 RepID=A0ABY4RMZ3_9BACL|nr:MULTISPECIES: hypothetical protein [Paenibacillus]MCS7463960.1 hypothetical protein [Paenibacillus doosanensis]UQZ83821.1 hypothetical protein SK3146_03028 [Paenibacillus konkukensis]
MPTFIGIAFAAVFVAARWIYFHTSRKQEVRPDAVDAEFLDLLNNGDRHE